MASGSVSPATREKVARSVLENNLQVKPGERVVVEAWTHTLPWAVAFAREARRRGALPLVPYEDEEAYWDAVDDGEEAILGTAAPHEWAALRETDVYLHMWGPGDRVRMNALPAARQRKLFGFNDRWYRTAAKTGLRGARLELGRPYPSLARAYGVDAAEWTDQLIRATLVSPSVLVRSGRPIERALARGKRVRIRDDRGTDVTLGLRKRVPSTEYGRPLPAAKRGPFQSLIGLPSGTVRVALDESVADGTFVANRTNYYDDAIATGAVFHFRRGKLMDAEFEKGGDRFDREFRNGGTGRDRPGQLVFGLNPELRNTPQVEDRELGTVMVSLGNNRGIGGKNAASFFGWAISAGASVEIDGRPVPTGR